ncbi:GTP 3',8-cyclase MoaA [Maribellus maritimus]|uniref:GTP 3',8-cyclase MoaA n=1 Tax=Maribellus maritimus TaxID=2870838 RepID=UPI001EEC239E|nr:radical SAM protein [Maribellus maritimus]MCG6188814.1 radical SAM protein [Maribellus maritimus]
MFDRYNREINYLRISVTDRCNFRCIYCMPEEGVPHKQQSEILSFDEITEIVKVGAQLGITKIRLTGGEPLVQKNIDELVRKISEIPGISEITMTTNGVFLPKMAHKLKQAGLNRVNISLDTLNPEKFKQITRLGNLEDVLHGIDAAIEANLKPVKINFVRIPGVNKEDEKSIREFCDAKNLKLRFIRQMNLKTGEFYPVEGGAGGICAICNRLRLTADGDIVSCLHSSRRFNIRKLGIQEAFKLAVEKKPKCGVGTKSHEFFNIGG